MCNRYRLDEEERVGLLSRYGDLAAVTASEMYPDRVGLVARLNDLGGLTPDAMRWGFPPVQKSLVTNVRNTASNYWKPWLKPEWRCLVFATAFAEWSPGPPKGDRWFRLTSGEPFAFAGIYRPWSGTRGTKAAPVEGDHMLFAFLTCEPNAVVAPIHPKAMPVILPFEKWDQWLTGSVEEALDLQRPLAAQAIVQQP